MRKTTQKTLAGIMALMAFAPSALNMQAASAEEAGTVTGYVTGDVNSNQEVNVVDAQLTLNAYVNILTGADSGLTETQTQAADINLDGVVSIEDAQLILLYYVENMIAKHPVTWAELRMDAMSVSAEVPETDDTLTIVCTADYDVQQMIEYFTAANPQYAGKIKCVTVETGDISPYEGLTSYLVSGDDVDLVYADSSLDGDLVNRFVRPLSDLGFKDDDFAGCYPYTLSLGKNAKGELCGAAHLVSPGSFVYRSDLAKKYLGVSSPEEMQPLVKDWKTFRETAEKLSKASDGKTAMLASIDDLATAWLYTSHDAWLNGNGTLNENSNLKDCYEYLTDFRKNGYVTKARSWTNEWYAVGQDDSALGYFYSSWCLEDGAMLYFSEGEKDGASYGLYNITAGPSAWYWGDSAMYTAKTCNSRTAAHDFINFFTVDEEAISKFAKDTGVFVNNMAVMEKTETPNPLLGGQSPIAVLHNNAKAIEDPAVYDFDEYRLIDMFKDYESYDAFLKDAPKVFSDKSGIPVDDTPVTE